MWEWRTRARSPAVLLAMADREEVQGSVEASVAKLEVSGADRRDEAVVEGPRQTQGRMGPVPAGADRDLVGAQLARVEEAEELHPGEVGREELPVLADVVLAQVPRVVRLLGALRRQRQPVR